MKINLSPFGNYPKSRTCKCQFENFSAHDDMIPLPDHWATSPGNPGAGSTSPSPAPSSRGSGGKRILMAEDDPNSRLILKATLEKAGYTPLIARDGLEALAALTASDSPSIAVLDWKMPGMDGPEVCRRVRDLNKVVYVIFLTALATTENLVEALEAGADDYLTKPFKSAELIARIHVGFRIVNLQNALADRVKELEKALLELKALRG